MIKTFNKRTLLSISISFILTIFLVGFYIFNTQQNNKRTEDKIEDIKESEVEENSSFINKVLGKLIDYDGSIRVIQFSYDDQQVLTQSKSFNNKVNHYKGIIEDQDIEFYSDPNFDYIKVEGLDNWIKTEHSDPPAAGKELLPFGLYEYVISDTVTNRQTFTYDREEKCPNSNDACVVFKMIQNKQDSHPDLYFFNVNKEVLERVEENEINLEDSKKYVYSYSKGNLEIPTDVKSNAVENDFSELDEEIDYESVQE